MDIAGFMKKFNDLPFRYDYKDPTDYFEKDMIDAGFNFESDSEEFLTEFLIPHLTDVCQKLHEIDDKGMDILRAAGVDEMKIKWKNFENIKLGFFDRMKIGKLQEISEKLMDVKISDTCMMNAIYKNRPELQEKYGRID